MNLSKFKKSLLVISNLVLLLSCGEPSSSSEPTSSKDSSEEDSSLVEEDYKEELTKMLKELSKAVSYSSLVTVTSSTGTGENLQNYLNLYCFIYNCRKNRLEKVEEFLKLALNKNVSLKYRDLFDTKE